VKNNFWKLTLTGAFSAMALTGHAIPFDGSTGTTATVVVNSAGGAGVDYTSLKAASTAFNAVATLNRPWVLLIDSDLVETERVAFGTNVTAGNSLTIKPAPGKTPTITFSNATPFHTNSYYGCLVIGANNDAIRSDAAPTAASIFETNNAFIIDGSNTAGGTSRDLTLLTVDDATGYVIRVVGATHGFVLKNSILLHQRTASASNCIGFGAGNIPGFGANGDYKSDNALLENNYFESKATSGGGTGIGVNYSIGAFGTLPVPKHYEGHVIRNNFFDVKHRGISALYSVNAVYSGNEFHVKYAGTGYNSGAIQHLLQNGNFPSAYTITMSDNMILDLHTSNTNAGAFGASALALAGGTNASYILHNNVITGMVSNGATASDHLMVGIWGNASASNYDIQHNSVNVGAIPNLTGATRSQAAGIYINNGNKTTNIVRNNIVRYAAGKGAPFVAAATGTGAVAIQPDNVTGNNFYQEVTGDVGSPLAYIGTAVASLTPYADFAALSTAGYGTGGAQSVDPASTTPAWAADLSFASAPVGMNTVASSTVLTDINGQTRSATGAYPGAYRIVAPSSVNDWAIY